MRQFINIVENAQDEALFGPIYHRTKSDLTDLSKFDLSKASTSAVLGPAIYASFGDSKWDVADSRMLSAHVRGPIIDLTQPLRPDDAVRLGVLLDRSVDALPLLTLERRYGSVAAGLKAAGYAAAIHEGPGATGKHIAVFDPSYIVNESCA